MINIEKSGVIRATGQPRANIIPGTKYTVIEYTYPTSSYSDRFVKQTSIIPTASQYTLSFYAKSTVAGDKIRAHYYNPNTTTTCVSSQGISKTAGDGNMDFTLTTDWQLYWVVYTQTATTAKKTVIFPRMFSQSSSDAAKGTGTVSIRCVKFEEGDYPTAWVPNSNDTDYINDSSGFVEVDGRCKLKKTDYIQTKEFIEI